MNYETVKIPNSPSQRAYHYGMRLSAAGDPDYICWFSDYGKHIYQSVEVMADYQACRDYTAHRIKFYRSL